jgi:crotonobetainyl-CoA:carnitine CoA-transferase CaiB-like acyl-CoA transferase
VAITIRDNRDWRGLGVAMGEPAWAAKESYSSPEGRAAAHDEIDDRLREWTRSQSAQAITTTLQMFSVPAAPMYTARQQLHDPHFQSRGYGHWLDQQGLGWMAFEGPAFRATGSTRAPSTQAPRLGEHTRVIAADLLGLTDKEIDELISDGVLEIAPPNPNEVT